MLKNMGYSAAALVATSAVHVPVLAAIGTIIDTHHWIGHFVIAWLQTHSPFVLKITMMLSGMSFA